MLLRRFVPLSVSRSVCLLARLLRLYIDVKAFTPAHGSYPLRLCSVGHDSQASANGEAARTSLLHVLWSSRVAIYPSLSDSRSVCVPGRLWCFGIDVRASTPAHGSYPFHLCSAGHDSPASTNSEAAHKKDHTKDNEIIK